MALILVITDAGRAALVNAKNDGTNAVRIASVGVSATAVTAAPAATTLPGETKRVATISGGAVAKDVMHLVVRDETMDTYTLRSFALYLDNGVLFGLYGQATPIIEKSAQALLLLAVDVTLQDVAAGQITFGDANFLQPPATTDRPGVVELATADEAKAGTDAARGVTPATAKAAVRDWIGYTPANRAGDAFTGPLAVRHDGLRCGLTIAQATTGYGFLQFGEASQVNQPFNWHMGSDGIGNFSLYQGAFGTGTMRLSINSATIAYNGAAIWHANNDGAGSGLDADLLDGLHAADFIQRNAGGRPIDYDSGGGQMFIRTDTGGWDVGYRFRDTQGSTLGAFGATGGGNSLGYMYVGPSFVAANALRVYPDRVTWGVNAIWHAANDGAGSGLDADLLDGLQAAQLIRSDQSSTLAADVSLDFPNSTYGRTLRIGGNGYTTAGSRASVVVTNGNLHLDGATGFGIFLNHFAGDGTNFGNGASAVVANMSKTGALTCASVDAPAMRRSGMALVGFDNDGAGSGLDADLLDGRQGSEFALLTGAAYSGPVATPAVSVDGGDAILSLRNRGNPGDGAHGWNVRSIDDELRFTSPVGVRVRMLPFAGMDVATGLTRDGNRVWDAANDGAGSGLDADLLDGRDSASFANAAHGHSAADIAGAFPGSLSENGYTVLPNGLILQWVSGALMSAGQETTQLVYFPVAFPNACFGAVASTRDEFFSRAADVMFSTIGAPSPEAVTVGRKQFSGTSDDQVASRPFIIALGR